MIFTSPHCLDPSQLGSFFKLPGSGGVGRISCGLLSILCLGTRGEKHWKTTWKCDETWRYLRKQTSEYWEILHGKVRKNGESSFNAFGGNITHRLIFNLVTRGFFFEFQSKIDSKRFLVHRCITINHLPSTFGRPDCSMFFFQIFCKFNPGHPGRHNQVVLHNRFEPGWLKGKNLRPVEGIF